MGNLSLPSAVHCQGLLRRCAPRNDSGSDIASEAHVPPATPAMSEAWEICPSLSAVRRLRSAVCSQGLLRRLRWLAMTQIRDHATTRLRDYTTT